MFICYNKTVLDLNNPAPHNKVRPYVTEISTSIQGVAFDRLDLGAWVEQYKSCNGRPVRGGAYGT